MTEGLPAELRRQVIRRAGARCEYCGQMNRPLIVAIRTEEALLGRHPPD